MSAYIEKSVCRGVVPAGVPAFNFERKSLVSRLICNREKVRSIIAPSGYGKTALCAFYANLMFNFKSTVWFVCNSPCFLRDLIADATKEFFAPLIDEIKLCVFDELPHLSSEEIDKFKNLLKVLIESGVEVLINCAPESKNMFLKDEDTFCLKPKDLLCEENDINSIPALEFGKGNERVIFESLKSYGLNSNEMLLYYCMMMVKKGTFSDLEKFSDKRFVKKDLKFISKSMPHISIDFENQEFEAVDLHTYDIKAGFNFALLDIIKKSKFSSSFDFFRTLTDILIDSGEFFRAKEIAMCNFTVKERLRWSIDNSKRYANANNQSCALECLKTTTQQMGELRDEVYSCMCYLFYSSGCYDEALDYSNKILKSKRSQANEKVFACVVALLCSCEESYLDYIDFLMETISLNKQDVFTSPIFSSFALYGDSLKFMCDFLITWYDNPHRGLGYLLNEINAFNECEKDDVFRDVLCVCVSFVFRKLTCDSYHNDSLTVASTEVFRENINPQLLFDMIVVLHQFVFECLRDSQFESSTTQEILNSCDESLRVCEELCSDFLSYIDANQIIDIKKFRTEKVHDKLLSQQLFEKSSNLSEMALDSVKCQENDKLNISFFGGANFQIEGKNIDIKLTKRANCLYLAYLLAEDLGHEVSRRTIISEMWPENKSSDGNKRNFYNTLSTLKGAFMSHSKTNFIKRNQGGYYLDPDLCSTDLQEFDSFCNSLNFGIENAISNMADVASKVSKFSKPLIPQIEKFKRLDAVRFSQKERLVDSLIFASVSLLELKDFRDALWFAKEAKKLDRNREDTYYLMMKAQNGLNLRSSAVSTYFEYKTVMDEELGITPSPDIKNLYQMVIS